MMDALKAIDNDEVEVEFFGTMKPFILNQKQMIQSLNSFYQSEHTSH